MTRWERRFAAGRLTLPRWAARAGERGAYLAGAGGVPQVHVLDAGQSRQLTDQPGGVSKVAISPDGEQVWWFDEAVTGGPGTWRLTAFAGGQARQALPAQAGPLPAAGLALGGDGTAAIGTRHRGVSRIDLIRPGDEPTLFIESGDDLYVSGLSADGALLAATRPADGDLRQPEIVVFSTSDGSVAGVLRLPGGAHPAGFAPGEHDHRLLVLHEPDGLAVPAIYDVTTGTHALADPGLPGETRAEWYADGRHLLVCHIYRAGSTLLRHDLRTGANVPVGPTHGFVRDATTRPDGSVDLIWSSPVDPPACYRIGAGGELRLLPLRANEPEPLAARAYDVWADGPGGPVHALVTAPAAENGRPAPAVFVVHGGPGACDTRSHGPYVAAWVEHGYTVVRVNYRGSTGYGARWRTAADGAGGVAAVEDIAAVRASLVAAGDVDPARIAIAGASYGGYLALLAIGRHPADYAVAVAEAPVADYVAAYEAEPERLRALDRVLLGGSPAERPQAWEQANPVAFASQVRAPVLIMAGRRDPRCPFEQVERYVEALARHGAEHTLVAYDSGHGTRGSADRIAQVREQLAFVTARMPG